jgi:ABC-type multidrug transport system ATPase subunit
MSLLSLEAVTKRFRGGRRETVVLRDVWLELQAGELVSVLGRRRSGRTTLLRVASGLETSYEGMARFDGQDLKRHGAKLLGHGIGFARSHVVGAASREPVLEHVALSAAVHGVPFHEATAQAATALRRVDAADCADLHPRDLDAAEAVRVTLARALVAKPRLLLVDEPTKGVNLSQRDPILRLLRSIADDGIAVLATVSEAAELAGADRALRIGDGELRGRVVPTEAQVVPLRRPSGGRAPG